MKTAKKCLIFAAAAVASLSLAVGLTMHTAQNAYAEDTAFSMVKGASVRIATDGNGLRFRASLSKTQYEEIESDSVSYGMFIMPESYITSYGDLTAENVSGENAVYDWATYNESGELVYGGTKTRIINIEYDALPYDEETGCYLINGSITNLLEVNLARNFVGRAYINKGGTYTMAAYADGDISSNTRSILQVAKAAIADESDNAPTAEQKATMKTEFVAKAWQSVVDNPIGLATTSVSTKAADLASGLTTKTNILTGEYTKAQFISLDLAPYTKLMFYAKADGGDTHWFQIQDTATFGVDLGAFNDATWHAFYLVKETGGWQIYKDTINATGWKNLRITNLNELSVILGGSADSPGTFYVSDLVALEDPDYVSPYTTISSNPFTKTGTTSDMKAPGYSTVTTLTTSWNTYQFNSVDISGYSEVSFAVKSSGYYGVMFGGSVIGETNGNGEWLVIKFVKTGENTWTLYYGATEQQTLTLANNNLTDLTFRFGTDTFYVTELKGKKA